MCVAQQKLPQFDPLLYVQGAHGGDHMDLPVSNEAVLAELYAWKHEYVEKLHAAESRGDMKARHTLHLRLREIKSLIVERGGDLSA